MFDTIEILDCVDSTNEHLKAFIAGGVSRMVVAGEQTAGKGQHGRVWHSPPGAGLYVSYLYFPDWELGRSGVLNQASSLAVADSIRHFDSTAEVRLKQPNDVLVGGRKVCGILAELGSTGEHVNWAIIGIGVNLYRRSFPSELEGSATSLERERIGVNHPLDFCHELTVRLVHNLERAASPTWRELETRYLREIR